MVLTGCRTIRDVIIFPLMRPQRSTETTPTPSNAAPKPEQPHGETPEKPATKPGAPGLAFETGFCSIPGVPNA
jgi:hypothetical protein